MIFTEEVELNENISAEKKRNLHQNFVQLVCPSLGARSVISRSISF